MIVNGQLISYREDGKGKVILLLHGWGTELSTFDEMAVHLAQSYRVVRIDFPGFGGSPKPAEDWGVDEYAKLIKEFLGKREITHLYAVVGHSFGGRIILKGIGENYIKPDKVVLIGSAGVKPAVSAQNQIFKIIAKIGKHVMKSPGLRHLSSRARQSLYERAGSTDYINATGMQNIFIKVINEDLLDYAHEVSQPTLLLWGENDEATPLADAKKLHAAIHNSQLEVLSNAGHFVYLDKPKECLAHLKRFLS